MLNKARSLYSKLDRDGKDTVIMSCWLAGGILILMILGV